MSFPPWLYSTKGERDVKGHPFCDLIDARTLKPGRSYFERGKRVYGEEEGVIPFAVNLRSVGDYVNPLVEAGFVLERLLEPDSRQRFPYDPWYGMWDHTPEMLQLLPATIIFKSRKP